MSQEEKNKKNISNTPQNQMDNIIFERKGSKSKVKFGVKAITYLVIACVIGGVMANLTIKHKYSAFFQQMKDVIDNDNMIILDYTKVIKEVSKSLVTIGDSEEKLTSNTYFDDNMTGVIIDKNGTILTNYSGIKGKEKIYVKLSSLMSTPIEAKVVVEKEEIDLAIIKIDFDGELQPIKFAEKDDVYEGQGIIVLGNAIGDEYIGSAIPGIITSKNETIETETRSYGLLQINAPINKNNTGGAICNGKGELVGIANFSITSDLGEPGIYYGLQMEGLKEIINLTDSFKKSLGIVEGGIIVDNSKNFSGFYVQQVEKYGSAYLAGIKPTDIITKIDGEDISNIDDIILGLKDKKKGDILECSVVSEGEVKEVKIKLV